MNNEERDKEVKRIVDALDLDMNPERKLVRLAKQLDCEWDECPDRFHRFMLLSDPETHEPFAISVCIQEQGGDPTEYIFPLGDAFDMAVAIMNFLSTI